MNSLFLIELCYGKLG